MRAVVVQSLSGPDGAALVEVPEPAGSHWLTPGVRLLVEVHAAAICFPDLLQTRGLYQHSVPAPFISGGEIAGIVLEAPAGSGFAPGDRVAGLVRRGAMAERVLAPPGYLLRLPGAMSFAEGAALYINYSTAWFALHRAGTLAGETVLVQGAAGGVGDGGDGGRQGLRRALDRDRLQRREGARGARAGRRRGGALDRTVARGGPRPQRRARRRGRDRHGGRRPLRGLGALARDRGGWSSSASRPGRSRPSRSIACCCAT
jgi:hypothetical protein